MARWGKQEEEEKEGEAERSRGSESGVEEPDKLQVGTPS